MYMQKKSIFIALCAILLLSVSWGRVAAKETTDTAPETEGTYEVPGKPNMKVKVFVHRPKAAKPAPRPTPTPVIVCPGDTQSDSVIPPVGWKLPSSWTYTLNTASVPASVGSANWATIAATSFSQWTGALNGKVTITPTSSPTTVNRATLDNRNILTWGRTQNGALAVTYTWYYPDTGMVAEVDTIMNQKYPWFWNSGAPICTDANSYDAQNILTHELGHWVGLDDTYTEEFTENTMYGYGAKGETKKDTLTAGDITGAVNIYTN